MGILFIFIALGISSCMIKLKVCLLKPRLAGDFSKPLLASSVRVIAFIFPLRHEKDKVDIIEIFKEPCSLLCSI